MTDVVGLRFVAEGEQETVAALKRYAAVNTDIQRATQSSVAAIERMERQVQALQTGLAQGRVGQDNYAASLREIKRQYAALTGGSIQRASAEVERFVRVSREAANARLDVSAREQFEQLARSLDPAAAAVHRFEQAMQTLNAAQARGVVNSREYAEVQARLTAQRQQELERINGVNKAEQDAVRTKEQAAQAYDRLIARLDPAIAAQQRFAETQRTVNDAVDAGIITKQQGEQTMNVYRASLSAMEEASLKGETATSKLRQQFLATANSIAILDGPLGGIASRFSAFGVLLGRTGLLVGGLLVSVTALGAILNRGTRNLIEWEAANARVNAVLETTGFQVGLTGEQIRSMTSQIALATLETEQSVMQAAQRLLTFRDIAGDVFEDVLRTAADMAALGFGTIESEAVKLAKALEDPAQALTSLSRAGIVFTRQQRNVIISLVESGRQAEAMERILANVNARVGGAAEAAARDTMAGAFDTIGQAVSRAVREFAQATIEATRLDRAIRALAARAAPFAEGPETLEQQVATSRARLSELQQNLRDAQRLVATNRQVRHFGTAALERGQRLPQAVEAEINMERDRLRVLEQQLRVQEQQTLTLRARQQVSRDQEALDNLAAEVDLRRDILGLTEDEQRLQRSLAQLGLRDLDIAQRVDSFRQALIAAGGSMRRIDDEAARYLDTLREITAEVLRARDTAALERQARALVSNTDNLRQQNDLMHLQVAALRAGMSVSEARTWAEEQTLRNVAETLLQTQGIPPALRDAAAAFIVVQDQARMVKEQLEAAQQAANFRQELADNLAGLQNQAEVLRTTVTLLEQGVDFTIAQRLAEIEVQRARVQTLIVTQGITNELATQLKYLNAMSKVVIEIGDLETRVASFRPSRGGGGGSTQEIITLQALQVELLREQAIRAELLALAEEERRVREVYYDLVRRLGDEAVNYTEAQIMATAQLVAEQIRLNEETERQLELQRQVAQTLTNLFMAATNGADAFRQALAGVLRQLASMLANRAFMQMMGRFGLGLFAPLPNANGNVFSGGNVIPFAKGGVVNSPTMFPMAGGKTGLMGEAGPEAVMPLRRGADGKLGVATQPQKVDVDVRVRMDENGNWKANVEQIADRRVARAAPGIVSQSVASTYATSRERKMR